MTIICAMRVGLLVQDGCFGSGVAALLDIFAAAEVLRPQIDPAIPALELVVAGPRRQVETHTGMRISPTRPLGELDDLDVVVVPGLGTMTGPETLAAVHSRDGRAVGRALERVDLDRSRIAAACTGVFAVAGTGLLDGRRATTTWSLSAAFRA